MTIPRIRIRIWTLSVLTALIALEIQAELMKRRRIYSQQKSSYHAGEAEINREVEDHWRGMAKGFHHMDDTEDAMHAERRAKQIKLL